MFKDINLDEFKNTIVNIGENGKTITTDDDYNLLRNYIINYFVKNNNFWKQFKNIRIYNKIELEKTITETIYNKIDSTLKNKIIIETLIINNQAEVFAFMKNKNIFGKDKLLFDFSITL